MATIDDVAARHRAQVLAAERRAAGRILRTWANAADTIRRELAALQDRIAAAQAAGIPVSPDWLRREDRFRTLLATTEQQMRTLVAATEQTLYGSGRTAVRLALEHAGEHIAARTPWSAYSALDVAAVEVAVGLTSPSSPLRVILREMARDVPGATAQRIADRLTAGIALGQNPRKVAALIAQDLEGQRARALTVARTEMMRAYRTATLEGYRLQADLLTGWVWYSALDGRTCAACWSMHGKRFPLDEEMGTHPNCLVEGTEVSADDIEVAFRRWYSGSVVCLRTRGGHDLTVTPNHPVLTGRGWVAADELEEGDHLVCDPSWNERAPTAPDEQDVPTPVEEVFGALRRTSDVAAVRVPASAEHFHGDGAGGDVDVVRADGGLLPHGESSRAKLLGYRGLCRAHAQLAEFTGPRAALALVDADLAPPHSGVRSLDVGASLLRRSAGLLEAVRLGAATDGHAGAHKTSADGGASHSVQLSEGVLGNARQVLGDDLVVRQLDAVGSDGDASGDKLVADPGVAYPVPSREELEAVAGLVVLDELVSVELLPYAGHVYNLQTSRGWYRARGVVTHNCRCTMLPDLPDVDPVPDGADEFAALPPDAQLAILGPAKFDAYQAGALTLDDLVHVRRSPLWGTTRSEASLVGVLGPEGAQRHYAAARSGR